MPGADPESQAPAQAMKAGPSRSGLGLRRLVEFTKKLPPFAFEVFEMAYNLVIIFRLSARVRAEEAELIYERYSLFMVAGVWLARRRGIPIVLEINDSVLVSRVRPLVFAGIARRLEDWAFSNANGLVFISAQFQKLAAGAYPRMAASVVSPNAADVAIFSPDRVKDTDLRARLGLSNKVVLGYVGAFVHWHGIDWFVDLIAPRLKDFPQLSLLLVGDGKCFESLRDSVDRHGVADQVILSGRVTHNLVPAYIAAMDYGILPDSNIYGSPMKLFEFMAMAKGMVVPDFPPISEVVRDGETSWLFPASDREGCVQKALSLVGHPDEQKTVGTNARNYILEERQWRHNAEQLLSLI